MLVDANRTSQLPYATLQDEMKHNDRTVADAQHWLRSHIGEEVAVGELANVLGTTARTLTRRFRSAVGITPLKYLQRLRVEQAKRLLAISDQSIEQLAAAVGYGDVAGFRRIFERETSLTPGEYRARFRRQPRPTDGSTGASGIGGLTLFDGRNTAGHKRTEVVSGRRGRVAS
jgi:transcriptional regulator GlxA family with amidase domain